MIPLIIKDDGSDAVSDIADDDTNNDPDPQIGLFANMEATDGFVTTRNRLCHMSHMSQLRDGF